MPVLKNDRPRREPSKRVRGTRATRLCTRVYIGVADGTPTARPYRDEPDAVRRPRLGRRRPDALALRVLGQELREPLLVLSTLADLERHLLPVQLCVEKRADMCVDVCVDVCVQTCGRAGAAHVVRTVGKLSPEAGRLEYRRASTRAVGMPSAMPMPSMRHAPYATLSSLWRATFLPALELQLGSSAERQRFRSRR